jgi:hypothetical protein
MLSWRSESREDIGERTLKGCICFCFEIGERIYSFGIISSELGVQIEAKAAKLAISTAEGL